MKKIPPKKTVNFLVRGLETFHPDVFFTKAEAKEVESVEESPAFQMEREGFDTTLRAILSSYTGASVTDFKIASDIIRQWQSYYQKLEKGEPVELSRTVPTNLDELVEDLEGQKDAYSRRKAAKDLELASQRFLEEKGTKPVRIPEPVRPVETIQPAPPIETVKPATITEVAKAGIKLAVSPSTLSGFSPQAARVFLAPLKFVMDTGTKGLSQNDPISASATQLAFGYGLTAKDIFSGIERKKDLNPEAKARLTNLANSLDSLRSSRPLISFLVAQAYGGRTVEFFFDIQKIGITQAQIFSFVPVETPFQSYTLSQQHFAPSGLFQVIGQQVFGRVSSAILKRVASKATTWAATKLGVTVATQTVAAAIAPGVGNVLAIIGSKILGWAKSAISSFFKILLGKERDENKGLLVGGSTLALGALLLPLIPWLGAGILGIGLLTSMGAAAAKAGGYGNLASGGASTVQNIALGLTSVVVPAIGVPAIIAIIAVPVIVALILFIINSGALIVPPGPDISTPSESAYIGVSKTVGPKSTFDNSEIDNPISVEYIIMVTAKRGTLLNISFEYSCRVIREGAIPGCPNPANVRVNGEPADSLPLGEQNDLVISPAGPYEIKYSATYNSHNFDDSAIIDTFTVTADAEEAAGERSSGSASVIIGNPPTACFVFDEDFEVDPASKAIELAAIVELQNAESYMSQLCSGGAITLDLEPQVARWGGFYPGGGRIVIYPLGLGNHANAVYTLAHETGHHFASITSVYSTYTDFSPEVIAETPICSYPLASHPLSEDFAEMIALYVADSPFVGRYFDCLDGAGTNFQDKYPNHWDFARNEIFHEDLGW